MKVEFIFAADYAVAQEDGRLNAIGAGIRFISVPRFPHTIPHITIVMALDFDASETGKEFKLQVTMIAPDGRPVIGPVDWEITPPGPKEPGGSNSFRATVSAQHIELREAGDYRVVISANGRVLKGLNISARKAGRARRS